MSRRFILTILLVAVIGAGAGLAIFLAKGYRFSTQTGKITGTGIISVTSVPDQASVYLDGHLTTATNAHIDALIPKSYDVKIVKEGYIPWEKKIDVKEGLVNEVKATLFPAIPTVYPLSFNGVYNPTLSYDNNKVVYVVPGTEKKSGIWVWTMADNRTLTFATGAQPHQVALPQTGLDYTKATFRWSPDSSQILVTLPDRSLLLNADALEDPPRDITAILEPTINSWDAELKTKNSTRIAALKDLDLRKTASASANLEWSPDETKLFYQEQPKAGESRSSFKVADLAEHKTYDIPAADKVSWLYDSKHLILIEKADQSSPSPAASVVPSSLTGKISVVEFDGSNQEVLYIGNFDTNSVFPWPDGSRLMMVSSLPIPTAKEPNFYGINLK